MVSREDHSVYTHEEHGPAFTVDLFACREGLRYNPTQVAQRNCTETGRRGPACHPIREGLLSAGAGMVPVLMGDSDEATMSAFKYPLGCVLALALPCVAVLGQSEKSDSKGRSWLVGTWHGTFSPNFKTIYGSLICGYRGDGKFYLYVLDQPNGLNGSFTLSGGDYQVDRGACPTGKKGGAQFDITKFMDLDGKVPAIEGAMKRCDGDVGYGSFSLCSSEYANAYKDFPLRGSFTGGEVDRHGLVMIDLSLTRSDPTHLSIQLGPGLPGQMIVLEKEPEMTPTRRAVGDEGEADDKMLEATLIQWNLLHHTEYVVEGDPDRLARFWKIAQGYWRRALEETSDPTQKARLQRKLSGDAGLMCNDTGDPLCEATDSGQFCINNRDHTCVPKFAF